MIAGYLVLFILGLILGSYLNSWVWRAHNRKWKLHAFAKATAGKGGRSECVHCGRQLAWWENIPLVSFIILRGKCHTCKKLIPADYFLVELFTGILFVFVALLSLQSYHPTAFQTSLIFFRELFFIALLVVIFVYDAKYMEIPSGVVWSGTVIALLFQFFSPIPDSRFQIQRIMLVVLGMAIGGGFFLAQYLVSRGRWIGGGDVRMGVMIGALLGWPNILVTLFISYVLGALVSVPLLILKKVGPKSAIPFGTFLAVGTFVAMFFGNNIVSWYLGLIGW